MENLKTYYRNGDIGKFVPNKEARPPTRPPVNNNHVRNLAGYRNYVPPPPHVYVNYVWRIEAFEDGMWRPMSVDMYHESKANELLSKLSLAYPHLTFRVKKTGISPWSGDGYF